MHSEENRRADRNTEPSGRAARSGAGIQARWGQALLARIEWRGDEVVLDAGCGAGRLFPAILERIPRGRLDAVDSDAKLLAAARQQMETLRPAIPVRLFQQSLTELRLCDGTAGEPCLPEMVEVVLANGVFHWIGDKIGLFSHLIQLLRPDGRLLAMAGGEKHLQRIRAAAYQAARRTGVEGEIAQWLGTFHLTPAVEMKNLAKVCGFRQVRVTEQADDEIFPGREAFLAAASNFLFRSLRQSLAPGRIGPFLDAFADSAQTLLSGWRLDAVRQCLEARR